MLPLGRSLTSKIHPQLPLSPREQQQLLNLLTSSFRAHLDREHPRSQPHAEPRSPTALVQHVPQPSTAQTSANRHIDSILTNPLFSTPRRRASDPAHPNMQDIFKDPLGWFLGQAAIGAADIPKAAVCLKVLAGKTRSNVQSVHTKPGTRVAEWLWSSGLEASRYHVRHPDSLLPELIPLLVQEGEVDPIWRWFQQEDATLAQKTGLSVDNVLSYKSVLLHVFVRAQVKHSNTLDEALATFIRAQNHMDTATGARVLRKAGVCIISSVLSSREIVASPALYQAFLDKIRTWAGSFAGVMEGLLWLHHPSEPSALPGLAYIKQCHDSWIVNGRFPRHTKFQRVRIVELCLGVARQSMAEHRDQDAQLALEFVKDNFPDMVLAQPTVASENKGLYTPNPKAKEKEKNLQMLDSLLPG